MKNALTLWSKIIERADLMLRFREQIGFGEEQLTVSDVIDG